MYYCSTSLPHDVLLLMQPVPDSQLMMLEYRQVVYRSTPTALGSSAAVCEFADPSLEAYKVRAQGGRDESWAKWFVRFDNVLV